jgi:hypothetical protein
MKRLLFSAVLLSSAFLAPQISWAQQTDYQCLSDCQSAGYLYQFCRSKCSYGDDEGFMGGGNSGGILPSPRSQGGRIDYSCQQDCLNVGYQLRYCRELCEY